MYDGMKSLGCLDELYPHARGNKPKVATLEECIKFKAEHPDMTRRGVHQRHTAFYNAMKRLGCLDELYPKHIGGYTHTLTLDDCLRFKQEHPNMSRYDLIKHHFGYYKAMVRLGCFDKLYPKLRDDYTQRSDESIIEEARQYTTKIELRRKNYNLFGAIRRRKLEDRAFAHMEPVGNKHNRMIYAYEFADNTVYVGLTFNYEKRHYGHMQSDNSPVVRHMKATGLTPVHKQLTDYVPLKEAQRLEGEYVEQYKSRGWNILNTAKAGGVGCTVCSFDRQKAVEMWKQGMSCSRIADVFGVNPTTINRLIRQKFTTTRRRYLAKVKMVDAEGRLLKTFESKDEAAEQLKCTPHAVIQRINRHINVGGCYLVYDRESYLAIYGKEPKYGL